MKRRAIVIVSLLLIVQHSFAQADSVINRYRQYLFSTSTIASGIPKIVASLNSNGQWNDINYQDNERSNWKPLMHLKRINDLALAYANPKSAFYQQTSIKQTIDLALAHWIQKRYKSINWWYNEIGVPQQMRDILILVGTKLSATQRTGALEVLGQYQVQQNSTGANLTWSADLGLHYGLLTNDYALVQKCRDRIIEEIKITTGDGVQPDYSFHQHDKRLQMYQYGAAFLRENIRLAWQLRGTSWAFPKDRIDLLCDFVLKGWQWMTRGINTVPGTMDRSASRKDALHSPDIRLLLPYFIELSPENKKGLSAIADHQNGKAALNGFRYYPYSDFAAYQQNGFSFFVKTISARTLSTESINSENLKGHLLNSGDGYLISSGREYFNLMPVWNWEFLPGITSFNGAEKIKRLPFAGAVSDGKQGFSSMDYMLTGKEGKTAVAAKKSWFCNGNKIVCLIAGLKGSNLDSAFTVMDQCRWTGNVSVNKKDNILAEGDHFFDQLKWIQHGNFAYVPVENTSAMISVKPVAGKWTDINASESDAIVQDKIFMPVLLHKNLSAAVSLGYIMAYCKTTAEAMQVAKQPGCTIIRNDLTCQCILFADGTLMAAFFTAGTINFSKHHLTADKPCLVMISKNKLYASDPLQANDSVTVQFDNKTFQIQLPGHGFSTGGILLK